MMPDKCPSCGANEKSRRAGWVYFECGSMIQRSLRDPSALTDWEYRCIRKTRDTLWQLRLTLTEIAWAARCEYERTKKFNEGYDAGFSQARLGALIGTGGDTK